jgi:hypothetical protein
MIGKKKTNEEFISQLTDIHGDAIMALENYVNVDYKIRFKCNTCGHEWNTIPYIVLKGSGCPCCSGRICVENINSVYKLRPDLIKYFKNENDSKIHTVSSAKKVSCICPDCGYEKDIVISNLSSYGFTCDYCSDGISIPNKFTAILLRTLDIQFELEKTFKWSDKKRYDIYIPNYKEMSIIIENQGLQHENGNFGRIGGRNKEQETKNDIYKREIALNNNINKYIEICFYNKYNTFENCKDAILNSNLGSVLDLKNVEWKKIWEECQISLVLQVWNTWNTMNKKIRSTVSVGKIYGLDRTTIAKYLKDGVVIGKVEYNPLEEQKSGKGKFGDKHPNSIKVVCLNTMEIFESINLACEKYNITNKSGITKCCLGESLYCKILNNQRLTWRYYDDYLKLSQEEIKQILFAPYEIKTNNKLRRKIICLNNKDILLSLKSAGEKYNIKSHANIIKCCNEEIKSCGNLNEEKLVWRYLDVYNKLTEQSIKNLIDDANSKKEGSSHYKSKEILCITTGKVFGCQKEAGEYYDIKSYNNIGMCCRGKRKYCGISINGETLEWKYLNN